jgi:hypothetical protein
LTSNSFKFPSSKRRVRNPWTFVMLNTKSFQSYRQKNFNKDIDIENTLATRFHWECSRVSTNSLQLSGWAKCRKRQLYPKMSQLSFDAFRKRWFDLVSIFRFMEIRWVAVEAFRFLLLSLRGWNLAVNRKASSWAIKREISVNFLAENAPCVSLCLFHGNANPFELESTSASQVDATAFIN